MAVKLPEATEKLRAYVAGEQPRDKAYVKLNTNENPFPPSPRVAEVLRSLDIAALRLYPDPTCAALKKAIAAKECVKEENVFVSNGSDEALFFAFSAFYKGFHPSLPKLTYSFYPVYCDYLGITPLIVDMKERRIDFDALKKGDGAVFANPNAPTGFYEELDVVGFCKSTDHVVVIDEAYIDFSGKKSAVAYITKCKNLAVVKTFSKSYSLAGMRVGYVIADRKLIDALEKTRDCVNSYTVDAVAQAVALAALNDEVYHVRTVGAIQSARDTLATSLQEIEGVAVDGKSANFLLVHVGDGNSMYKLLKDRGVLVRYLSAVPDSIRVTIGTAEECDRFLQTLIFLRSLKK